MSRGGPLRLTAGLVVLAVTGLLSAECGGNDVVDSSPPGDAAFDGDALEGAAGARNADGPSEKEPEDSATPDTARADVGTRAEAGVLDAASVEADGEDVGTADVDADASDADAGDDAGSEGGIVAPALRSARTFAILASATVTNTGAATAVVGDVGISPGTALTGLTGGQVTGAIHLGDAVAMQAEADLTTAYNDLAGRPCQHTMSGVDLGGKTLPPGVYCFASSAAQSVGDLTLDGQGDPNAVWIFQIGSTLTVSTNLSTNMINGANACNVYWQVGSSATINGGAQFKGNLLVEASISLLIGADVSPGRVFAQTAAVTMQSNRISIAGCP